MSLQIRPSHPALLAMLLVAGSLPLSALATPACKPGEWSLASQDLQRDGSHSSSKASSRRYCELLDGDVWMEEFRAHGDDGSTTFRGVSLRHPEGDGDDFREAIVWLMVGDPGITRIDAQMRDGAVRAEGRGHDAMGAFEERATTTFHSHDGDYRFRMDRRYDGSKRWLKDFNRIDATRLTTPAPALPKTLAVEHAAARGAGLWHHAGRVRDGDGYALRHRIERRWPVLDGQAMAFEWREYDNRNREIARRVGVESMVRQDWRRVIWTPADGSFDTETLSASESGWSLAADNGRSGKASRNGDLIRQVVRQGEQVSDDFWLRPLSSDLAFGAADPGTGCGDFGFVLGEQRIDAAAMYPDQRPMPGVGWTRGFWLADGAVMAEEMRVMFEHGGGFAGVTFRTRGKDGAWHVGWTPEAGATTASGLTDTSKSICEEVHHGADDNGAFEGRLRLVDFNDQGFDVRMDNQYKDGGPLIKDAWQYRAHRLPVTDGAED